MALLACIFRSKGLLNVPGVSSISKNLTEKLLLQDTVNHHCICRAAGGLHNHLGHHVLAAYDMGAPPNLLQKIYDDEAAQEQRPVFVEEGEKKIVVTENNWSQYVGNSSAYGGFYKFFSEQIQLLGATETLERYIFSSKANEHGVIMLVRLVSGAVHPFIQLGYAAEFESDMLFAAGLAQTAIHDNIPDTIFEFIHLSSPAETSDVNAGGKLSNDLSLLDIFREIYDSEKLQPPLPYDANALFRIRRDEAVEGERAEEIRRICSKFHVNENLTDEEWDARAKECIWAATLLTFGTGREGQKPRLDFFFMHLLTSCLFIPAFLKVLKNSAQKALIFRAYVPVIILFTLARGRPRINPGLLMTYTETPRPPLDAKDLYAPHQTSLGNPLNDGEYNPWPVMAQASLYHPDAHVVKSMRTLVYAAQHYGDTPPGGMIGAFRAGDSKEETHSGTSKMDGTIFTRAAGMMMDYMGWITHGQAARENWDRSALGWDAAWEGEVS